MKKRMLFIGSLPTKKVHYNGETNKTGDVFSFFLKSNQFKITRINLTHFKLFYTIKMIACSFCKKYDVIFVSKCVVGGSLIVKLLSKYGRKSNKQNIVFYWIGNGIEGFEDKRIYLDAFKICKTIIFESEDVRDSFKHLVTGNSLICPCIKPCYNISLRQKDYSNAKNMRCIFFSRVVKEKGLMDAIGAIEKANRLIGYKYYSLDIAGAATSSPDAEEFEKRIVNYIKNKDEFTYFGKSFCVTGIETYLRLQDYDLHLFPTHFKQECAPGSIIDMFIAGIPTISSSFPNVNNILSNEDSYIFEQGNVDDLVKTLLYIFEHPTELNAKRKTSFQLQKKYDEHAFYELMKQIKVME